MPVTLHQPLPSHWYISEARRLYPSRSKLASLEFGRQSAPSAPIGPSHIHRALDRPARSVRDRVLICSDGSLLQQPMDGGGLSTAALDERKANAPP